MNSVTVLITAAGNAYMPGICKSIKKNGERKIRLVGVDMNKDDTILQMCDTYYQGPRADSPDYVDFLLDICQKECVDVLLPVMSAELEKIAENIGRFEKIGTRVSVSDLKQLKIANNKLALFEYLEKAGLPCPKYMSIGGVDDIDPAIERIGSPCVFKMNEGSGSRGMRIIDPARSRLDVFLHEKPNSVYTTVKDLKETLNEGKMPPMHAMEYLPGEEYTVDILANKGDVLYSLCRRGLNVQSSIILDGVVENRPEITNMCSEVVSRLQLHGNVGIDIKERADGTPVIIECNPRVTAGVSEFTASGVNLLYLCIKMLLGESIPHIEPKYGIVMKRRYTEMFC